MSEKDDGGRAFPFAYETSHPEEHGINGGMTLRDYFAAKAMQIHGAALSDMLCDGEDKWDSIVAARAYKTADAMLKERAK